MRSLSRPLLHLFLVLLGAVFVGCLYTWEQLAVSHLLGRIETLQVARQHAHQELMSEWGRLREAQSRGAVEDAALGQGLRPPSPEQLIILTFAPPGGTEVE